ncbi:MAG: type I methionyl aminopeptidase [Phycisphaerae bacterium]|nr:type I methionyl aminopeptidase [Phycisphaerae bacterium]
MAISLKTREQIERMRQAGQTVRYVLDCLGEIIASGVTTEELDVEAEKLCLAAGGKCLFKGVPGRGKAGPFPGCICVSINEQVVHGMPSKRVVRDGDIVSVDFGVELGGWCGDAAETFMVGQVAAEVRRLVEVTRNSLEMAKEMMLPGRKWSNIAGAMQSYIESEGLSVVREFVGHGIGRRMWEEPKVPNFVSRELESHDIVLAEGMVLAVEPMVNLGSREVLYAPDGWTVVTRDGRPSAHFEHTLAVAAGGADVLTTCR